MNKGQRADDEELKAKSKKFYALCSMPYEKYLILALCSLLSILSLLSLPSSVQSTICVGECVCSNCHTMHNSQNAESMRLDKAQIIGSGAGECLDCHAETRAVLLQLDCVGCHAKDVNGGLNIIDEWPQVAHNAGTNLAGGNYKYVFGDDTKGHNVHGFGAAMGSDSNLGDNPPGYKSDYDPASTKYATGKRLQCAGSNGCHGNRDQVSPILAMRGTHHASDSMLKFGSIAENQQGGGTGGTTDYTTAGKSYRFLYNVHGGEENNWEGVSPGTTVHNEYKGADNPARGTTQGWSDIKTISQFCAECHGDFHTGSIGSASPWFRHPTDVSLPATGEYTAYTAYNLTAPVARTTIPNSPSGTVTPSGNTDDIIMCLSCHRAHASPYFKIMRWDYKSSTLSTALSGCNVCHTGKN